jgi:hypothetical protein
VNDDLTPSLPPMFKDLDQAVQELGTILAGRAGQILLEMLESYEVKILVHGIEDSSCSKDYLRGFVHAVRAMRQDVVTARAQVATRAKAEEMAKLKKPQEPFRHPGSGPGGLS